MYQSTLYAKNSDSSNFNLKDLSNYFSAVVSYGNNKNNDALKFFESSKSLTNKHTPYLKQYIFSLVIGGEVDRAIRKLDHKIEKKNIEFFESYFLMTINSIKKGDLQKSKKHLNDLARFTKNGKVELILYETLKSYIYLFENKKILANGLSFNNLSIVTRTFQNCYLNKNETQSYFINLVNNVEVDYSRYIFFYINYLISENKFNEVQKIADEINTLNSTLLLTQTKNWISQKNLKKFQKIFSCQNETDIISELLFLIANLYSSQYNLEKSNFYLNISNFLNPKFKFNLTLLSENYYDGKDYNESKKILNNFNKDDDIYYWYKVKKIAKIISIESSQKNSLSFINSKFKDIKKPSIKILLDIANINKDFMNYDVAISYYNQVLHKINKDSLSYANILYKRGACYERLGKFDKSDKDLLMSLEVNPNDPYVLNYLAYSWLERNLKIETAIKMLEKAYNQKYNDPFIIDSIGWAYYLNGELIKAEKYLKKAVQISPDDPVINDHYGDILWKLNKKIEAKYFWESVLNLENVEEKIKEDIHIKILKGIKKI